jgi:hypothetical protein
MDMETGPFGKPVPDAGCLVRSIIIHHDVYIEFGRYVGLDDAQEFPKFLRPVTPMQLPDATAR